jgi:hypothetical protein
MDFQCFVRAQDRSCVIEACISLRVGVAPARYSADQAAGPKTGDEEDAVSELMAECQAIATYVVRCQMQVLAATKKYGCAVS